MAQTAMDALLAKLAESVSGADDLEALTRPLLQMLETVTGLQSTYLTTVDEKEGVQRILFSRNTSQMQIPEGLAVPWGDTLCKRALDENKAYTDDVSGCWGDSDAARQLGIKTYMSQPVRTSDGQLFGTLCGASAGSVPVPPATLAVFTMFAELIAHRVERENLIKQMSTLTRELAQSSMTDPLTRPRCCGSSITTQSRTPSRTSASLRKSARCLPGSRDIFTSSAPRNQHSPARLRLLHDRLV